MRGERFQVAVVGAGAVGATSAYAMLVRGAARRVVLHDINAAKVRAEVLDLGHGAMFVPEAEIDGSDDVEICGGSMTMAPGSRWRCRRWLPTPSMSS